MTKRLIIAALVASSLAAMSASTGRAQPLEQAVKAAFLPKFAPYVGWPAIALAPNAPLNICVVGRDPFGSLIDEAAAEQRVGQHSIAVRRAEAIDRTTSCHIAFVGGSSKQTVEGALAVLRGSPVLSVTDGRFSDARGMVHFELHQARVRFHIDSRSAKQAGLSISSRLLDLALSVRAWWAPEHFPHEHG